MTTTRGVKKVSENILTNGRAIIVTEKDKDKYKWDEIPVGSKFIDTKTGIEQVKLEGQSDWVPAGIKNDGTLCIAKDMRLISEVFTIVNAKEDDHYFVCKNDNGQLRHYLLANNNQYEFVLEKGSYQMGRNQIEVIIDDCLIRTAANGGVTEKSETKVVLQEQLYAGQKITINYGNVLRIGNPYPRVFINRNIPDNGEIGDFWLDTDASVSEGTGDDPDTLQQVEWARIKNHPTTLNGYGITDDVSHNGHMHNWSDIVDAPVAMKANGGNADTVRGLKPGTAPNNILQLDSSGKVPVSCISQIPQTILQVKNISGLYVGPTAPQNPSVNDIWFCTSTTDRSIKVFQGGTWLTFGSCYL